jgi:arylsulfatase A-like enzyme
LPFKGRFTADYRGRLKPWSKQLFGGSDFLKAVTAGRVKLRPGELGYLEDQYDEGVAHADDRLGGFLEFASERGNPYVIVTADHGEEFMEHGGLLHGTTYEEILRVPLVIRPPAGGTDSLGAPRRIREPVCLVDLRPTLCALAGLPPPRACQGRNLLPRLRGEAATLPEEPLPLYPRTLRYEGFKLMRKGERKYELYDLGVDPGERTNRVRERKLEGRLRTLADLLARREDECRALRAACLKGAPEEDRAPVLDPGARERLRALGY